MLNTIKQVLLRKLKLVPTRYVYLFNILLLILLVLLFFTLLHTFIFHANISSLYLDIYLFLSPFVSTPDDYDESWVYPFLKNPIYHSTRILMHNPNSLTPIAGIGFHEDEVTYDFFILNKNLILADTLFKEIYKTLLENETFQAILKEPGVKHISLCTRLDSNDDIFTDTIHPYLEFNKSLTPDIYAERVRILLWTNMIYTRDVDINCFKVTIVNGELDID